MLDQHTEIGAQYQGPLTLNARGIRSALSTILKKNESGDFIEGTEMSLNDLGNLLNYLECIVMCDNIFLDGTLPPKDIAMTTSMINESDKMFGLYSTKNRPQTSFISVDSEKELCSLCKEAVEQSSELIKDLDVASIESIVSKPVRESDIEPFESCFKFDLNANERRELSQDIAKGVLNFNTFRGSKCVLGLLIAESETTDLYALVRSWFLTYRNNTKVKACLISALINRFRTNYINALSSIENAAYLADPSIEDLKTQQTQLLWKYVLKQIAIEKNELYAVERGNEVFKKKYLSFPIGMAVLLNTEENDPHALLETALELRNNRFNKLVVKKSKNRVIHNYNEDELAELQDLYFGKFHWKAKKSDKNTSNWFYKFTQFSIPAILGAAFVNTEVNIGLEEVTHSKEISSIAGALSGLLAEKGLRTVFGKMYKNSSDLKIYSDTVKDWSTFYEDAWMKEKGQNLIHNKVDKVFGRKLAFA